MSNRVNTSQGFRFAAFVVLEILGGSILISLGAWCGYQKPLVPEWLKRTNIIDLIHLTGITVIVYIIIIIIIQYMANSSGTV